ncbi:MULTISPECIES: TerB family tellurite resistance protein [Sphingobacterium]|uniref:TerB family tellurite resistance protein n=1 Tax=Sphingobacterium TaxID=28453 RepID=UPI0028AB8BDA|nr:TerB family tellurite resistance protein [Sphingobacterium multivorum]
MKKYLILPVLLIMMIIPVFRANAQADEIAQLLLNVEKLTQFKGILKQMKDGYQILDGGYNTVRDISQGNFNLHKTFLDGLLEVSPTVKNYRKVGEIINGQIKLVKVSRNAMTKFSADKHFNSQEINYISKLYENLLGQSLQNLDELVMIVTAGKLRMSDDDRLKAIDRIHKDMQDKLSFLGVFNNDVQVLSFQRSKAKNEIDFNRRLNGLSK